VPNHHLHIPTQHFTVAALKDAWAYDEEEVDDGVPLDGSEGQSEGSSRGTVGRKSLLFTEGSREKRRGEVGVEKKGNTSKVGVEVEVLPGSKGPVEVSSLRGDAR
jgi:dynactin-4